MKETTNDQQYTNKKKTEGFSKPRVLQVPGENTPPNHYQFSLLKKNMNS